jgi:hypothetical protein
VKIRHFLLPLLILLLQLVSCGPAGSDQVPIAELPDPAIYALTISELPVVGPSWQPSYHQTTTQQGYKWSYMAYQAYQAGSIGGGLESAFAVNNDVILYEVDMHREDLPQPPQAFGNIQDISWKSVTELHRLGDKSAVWKTSIGELLTPLWWLEFYQGHAYVRIGLLGFPDQIAPSLIYGLGDIIASRLPRTVDTLRSDVATVIPTQSTTLPTATLQASPAPTTLAISPTFPVATPTGNIPILSYTAPPGETSMLSYFDDTGSQLADGIRGADDILADLGSGAAYEWVGWTYLTEPVTLTFTLQADASIGAVEIGLNHRDGLGIFVPSRVTINGQSFELAADAVPNNQRKDLTFTGPFTGPTVTIALNHRGRGEILVDEVSFIPTK